MHSLLLLLALTTSIPAEKQRTVIDAVKAQLKDPDSAKFRGLKPMGDKGGICGWVNAKNGYGGYSGYQVFFYNHDGRVALLTPDLSEPSLC
jgi:hypothetical protein